MAPRKPHLKWRPRCGPRRPKGTGLTINIVNPGAGANTPGMAEEMRRNGASETPQLVFVGGRPAAADERDVPHIALRAKGLVARLRRRHDVKAAQQPPRRRARQGLFRLLLLPPEEHRWIDPEFVERLPVARAPFGGEMHRQEMGEKVVRLRRVTPRFPIGLLIAISFIKKFALGGERGLTRLSPFERASKSDAKPAMYVNVLCQYRLSC